jgi:hypothetical protein
MTRRGASSFVYLLNDNLFEPLSQEAVQEYEAGDGGELRPHLEQGRMYAVNSSSALVANLFHYWRRIGQVAEISIACQLPSVGITGLHFEAHYPIDETFDRDPNLDVVISYGLSSGLRASAIECKFLEPINRTHPGLRPTYLKLDRLWTELPALREIAEHVTPENNLEPCTRCPSHHGPVRRGSRILEYWRWSLPSIGSDEEWVLRLLLGTFLVDFRLRYSWIPADAYPDPVQMRRTEGSRRFLRSYLGNADDCRDIQFGIPRHDYGSLQKENSGEKVPGVIEISLPNRK